jgi:hypothetical protein
VAIGWRIDHLRAALAGSLDAVVSEADGLAGSWAMRCCLCGFTGRNTVARRLATDRSATTISKIQDLGAREERMKWHGGTHELGRRIGKLLEQIVF